MADVSSTLRLWSATAASNNPAGTTIIGSGLDDNLRQIQAVIRQFIASSATNMASAATVDLSTADGFYINITGTTTITALGTEGAGLHYLLKFAGALTLTHNATSLILPGAANITTAAGDLAWMISEGSGNWRCLFYTSNASGTPPTRSSFTATITGMTASVTGTAYYSITNNTVVLDLPALTGTSNTTACTVTGLPAAIQPVSGKVACVPTEDNGTITLSYGSLAAGSGTITLRVGASSPTTTFTNSGTKGLPTTTTWVYTLN